MHEKISHKFYGYVKILVESCGQRMRLNGPQKAIKLLMMFYVELIQKIK